MLATPPHPNSPDSSPSPPGAVGQPGAALPVVRQALERALLQSNGDFWVEAVPEIVRADQKCFKRRRIEAMQFFLRLYILVSCQGAATPVLLVFLTVQVRQSFQMVQPAYHMCHTTFCMCVLHFNQQPPLSFTHILLVNDTLL